jgi:hypothetical protein
LKRGTCAGQEPAARFEFIQKSAAGAVDDDAIDA